MSLREVETRTGLSNAYLSQLENGKITKPSPSTLHKLADCYGASYIHLLELAGHPVPTPSKDHVMFRASVGLEELSRDEERELLDYLQFLRTRKQPR